MKRKSYPSDLTDTEWKLIEPLLPKPLRRGPKENVDLREVVNGIFYLLQEGCRWRSLPHDLPPICSPIKTWGSWLYRVNTAQLKLIIEDPQVF